MNQCCELSVSGEIIVNAIPINGTIEDTNEFPTKVVDLRINNGLDWIDVLLATGYLRLILSKVKSRQQRFFDDLEYARSLVSETRQRIVSQQIGDYTVLTLEDADPHGESVEEASKRIKSSAACRSVVKKRAA